MASGPRTYYLVKLEEIILPEAENLEEQREVIRQTLRYQREQEVLAGYIQGLREELRDKITIHEELM